MPCLRTSRCSGSGRIRLQAVQDCDIEASHASVGRLAVLKFQAFFLGHCDITFRGESILPRMAQGEIDKLAIPEGIL